MIDTPTQWTRQATACGLGALLIATSGHLATGQMPRPDTGDALASSADYCTISDSERGVVITRPSADEPVVDDVNWFARPVPNPQGHHIVAFASHNENYLYDLTEGRRIRIPDRSDAVATPDGRYMTVPSHYTEGNTINFYDLPTLLDRLEKGQSAADVRAVFVHGNRDVHDVYYQSVGVLSSSGSGENHTATYRMMFSGSRVPAPPGFRIIDYTLSRRGETRTTQTTPAMRLCPEIVNDMATPFISKDGRYVVAHDGETGQASLKIFEIVGTNPREQTTSCRPVLDFGFVAGKADFSFDGSQLTFHVATHDYLTAFVDGGLRAPIMTDVMVVDLERNAAGDITGHGPLTRLTLSRTAGTGSYFPAFFPDSRIFYIANRQPRESEGPKRFDLVVADPAHGRRVNALLTHRERRDATTSIGELWRSSCLPEAKPLDARESAWYVASLSAAQCQRLVEERAQGDAAAREMMRTACSALN